MTQARSTRMVRWLVRRFGGDSEARTLRNVRQLQQVGRISAIFGVTVLVPALLLAWFALSSIRAEELLVDAELQQGAQLAAGQVHRDVASTFTDFERTAIDRVSANQSPLESLGDMSPWLRAAFRFDGEGTLTGPFKLPERSELPQAPPRYVEAWRDARRAEAESRWQDAEAAWQTAADATREPTLAGETEYALARLAAHTQSPDAALQALAEVYANRANVRDRHGFRIGDLARLKRAEILIETSPDEGRVELQRLVDDLLATRWTIRRPGEAAVTRRALAALERVGDPDWVGRARTQLDERTGQLFWADRLAEELDVFEDASLRGAPGEFRYYASPQSGTLWATLWDGNNLYAFSFDQAGLLDSLAQTLSIADALDSDIAASFAAGDGLDDDTLLTRRSLAPWLPYLWVVVAPADPGALAELKAQKRLRRLIIILIAVGMAVLGVVLSARLVGAELESARIKADFAANVSHELRSPITQIRLKGESLQLDLVYDEEDRKAHYDAIVREAERLSRLVDNILDFAAIERGAKTYMLRPEDLAGILANQVRAAEDYIQSRSITLEVSLPDDLPMVWLDREAVGQVITNFLSNAVKYGGDGGWIGVSARSTPEGVSFSVADRGIGMTKEDAAQVFEHFFRSEDPKVRRKKGTGIGLTIVRYIVEEHGGNIAVDTAPGEGTTFTVTFPLAPPEGQGVRQDG